MTDPKKLRKRFRLRRLTSFSLRTALIVITVMAVWLGLHMNSVRKQRASVEAVLRHGGGVSYDYQLGDVRKQSSVPAWLLEVPGPDHFLPVTTAFVHHEAAKCLGGFPRLKALTIEGPQLRDTDLEYISPLTDLQTLAILPPVTAEGRCYFDTTYGHTEITDDGLIHLKPLTQLRTLRLTNSNVTEVGLRHLVGLKNMKHLHLNGSKVKDASWLQERLPNCKIYL